MALGAHMYHYSYIYYAPHRDGVLHNEYDDYDNIEGRAFTGDCEAFMNDTTGGSLSLAFDSLIQRFNNLKIYNF